jgi:recombination protein RecR
LNPVVRGLIVRASAEHPSNYRALSALDGVTPERLNLPALLTRIRAGGVGEVILAMNATVEGQTTAHYLMDALEPLGVKITRLAHGVPVGGELDYLDEGTLSAAFKARRPFSL